ncbi:hypothetical protein FRB99_002004 [Tulasnella sp. 403]|nr:hypothetical protein FRB99_002004 [Tulasnella sp. 403]
MVALQFASPRYVASNRIRPVLPPRRYGSPPTKALSFSSPTKKSKKRAKQRRTQSRSPVPVAYPYVPFPYAPPPVPAVRQNAPQPRRSSWLEVFSPTWPQVIVAVSASIAIMAICLVVIPITRGVGNVVDAIAAVNPAQMISAVVVPAVEAIGAIPAGEIWCNTVGFGCLTAPRDAPYTTESFDSLQHSILPSDISLGNDFFDCLSDLRITRQQQTEVAHLRTLAPKVRQWGHVLENADELASNLRALARELQDVISNANAARVNGREGVRRLVSEFEQVRSLSPKGPPMEQVQNDFFTGISSAQRSLEQTAKHTSDSSEALKSAATLASKIADRAHSEISRLRRITNEEEMGLKYLAYGLTRPTWKYLQPGLLGMIDDRRMAGEFLKEVIKVVDEGTGVLLANTLSLQQCTVNTRSFTEQVEKVFSLNSEQLSIQAQVQYMIPRVDRLGQDLTEFHRNEEMLKISHARASQATSAPPS